MMVCTLQNLQDAKRGKEPACLQDKLCSANGAKYELGCVVSEHMNFLPR